MYIHTRSDGKLFNLARLRDKTKVSKVLVRDLLFADDAALVSHSASSLQCLLNKFSVACYEFALVISTKKTVVMHQGDPSPVMVNNQQLESVKNFEYLRSTINRGLTIEQELQTRIGRAASSFCRLRERAWQNKYLTVHTKCHIYECCILNTLLYGAETWTTYARHEKKLNAFHPRCLWRIMGINRWDRFTNEEVLSRAGSRSLFQTLKMRRMRWLGHLRRMPDGHLPKDILCSELCTGSRSRGRPMLHFKEVAKCELVALNIDTKKWVELAEDRTGWRNALRKRVEALEDRWLEQLAIQRLAL